MNQKLFDFSEIPVVDTHVHGPLLGEEPRSSYEYDFGWYDVFVSGLMPKNYKDSKLEDSIREAVISDMESRPRMTSIRHYISESMRFETTDPTIIQRKIWNKIKTIGLKQYANTVFERERIKWVLVDHSSLGTSSSEEIMADYPDGKKRWTYPVVRMIQPDWAREKKLESADDIARAICSQLDDAKTNGCSGFKSTQAYFRDYDLEDVSSNVANDSYRKLAVAKPEYYEEWNARIPVYRDPETSRALKLYQDFCLKTIFQHVGEIGLTMVIHVAVAVAPQLKPWLNDPSRLYSVFDNADIRRAGTKFLLIHTGFPDYHKITSLITQYPNVFVDLSFFTQASLLTHQILSEFVSISSAKKIMHGSDGFQPDPIGYAAHNTRSALSRIASWLYEVEHWSESECLDLAEQILHKNAERLFGV